MRTTRQWLEDLGLGQYAEAFEGCEYGSALTDDNLHKLFPFISS